MPHDLSRYVRQTRFAPLGEAGQRRLAESRALVVGCGALGTHAAQHLVRSGVGRVRIVDRDFVDLSNLQRQVLFDEDDVAAGTPKAIAAAEKLRRVNSQVEVEPVVADVDSTNVLALAADVDCLLDATDNFETRFLLNDAALELGLPWVYSGAVGSVGQTLTIVPGETPCLRCVLPEPPGPGETPTCDSAGVLAPVVAIAAALASAEALKILSGNGAAISRSLARFDVWKNEVKQSGLAAFPVGGCPACGPSRERKWLSGELTARATVLCGRNAVQLARPGEPVPLRELAAKLEPIARTKLTPFFLRIAADGFEMTLFPDGRAIVVGTEDAATARGFYARYVGG